MNVGFFRDVLGILGITLRASGTQETGAPGWVRQPLFANATQGPEPNRGYEHSDMMDSVWPERPHSE